MLPDLNEQLTIKSLYKHQQQENLKIYPFKSFQKESGLEEVFFIATLLSLEKKKFIEIGFKHRDHIVKVKNWKTSYTETDNFYIGLTKEGLKHCIN